jgi:glutamyl-tRNA reductase
MRILCVGASHKTAGVELRERLAYDDVQAGRALGELLDAWPHAEFAILSTCNRTEVYTIRPVHGHPRGEELSRWLARSREVAGDALEGRLYTLADAEAAEHLFLVAGGLDSLVPGEAEIVRQVKRAHELARDAGSAGAAMNDLFQTALHTAKHVRSETPVSEGRVSVASVAVDCARRGRDDLAAAAVLSIGAGEMNQRMIERFAQVGVGSLAVSNRSSERAEQLAADHAAAVVPFDKLARRLAEFDVVVTSTASDAPVLTRAMLQRALTDRDGRDIVLVDIAVPRDVEPSAGELTGVHLFNIDDLESVVRTTVRDRRSIREDVQPILDEHVAQLLRNLHLRTISPVIDALYRSVEAIGDEEFQRARRKLTDADTDPVDVLAETIRRVVRRTLHPVADSLRNPPGKETARADAAALQRLFDLDVEE